MTPASAPHSEHGLGEGLIQGKGLSGDQLPVGGELKALHAFNVIGRQDLGFILTVEIEGDRFL